MSPDQSWSSSTVMVLIPPGTGEGFQEDRVLIR